ACLGDRVPEIRASVADDQDVAAGLGGQDGARELQRGGEVGVVGVQAALEVRELRAGADVDLELGVAAEAHHSGAISALALADDLTDGSCLAVDGALRARREV